MREVEQGIGGGMVMEEDLAWGGEHTIKYIVDVLQNCTVEIYIILLINVTLTNSIKKGEIFLKRGEKNFKREKNRTFSSKLLTCPPERSHPLTV